MWCERAKYNRGQTQGGPLPPPNPKVQSKEVRCRKKIHDMNRMGTFYNILLHAASAHSCRRSEKISAAGRKLSVHRQEKKWGSLVSHARIVQDNAIGSELGRFNPLQHSRPIQPIRHGWRSIFGSIRETMVGIELLRSRHGGELSRAYPIVSTVDAVYDVSLSANLRHRSHSEHHEALHSTRT